MSENLCCCTQACRIPGGIILIGVFIVTAFLNLSYIFLPRINRTRIGVTNAKRFVVSEFILKVLHILKKIFVACLFGIIFLLASEVYLANKTGVGLCAPGRKVESSVTNSKNMKAEIHLCPDGALGYHYYLETSPKGRLFEKRPSFSEGSPSPTLEWIDDKTLKITMPRTMYYDTVPMYNGINIIYANDM